MVSSSKQLALQACLWLILASTSDGFSLRSCKPPPLSTGMSMSPSAAASFASSVDNGGNDQLPSIEELSSAPFMKQVQYGMELTAALRKDSEGGQQNRLKDSLMAQLSHSDGIRGFMVAFLTAEYDDPTVNDDGMLPTPPIPPVVLEAVRKQLDPRNDKKYNKELVPLICMNVVMPTGMITMHKDPDQSASSARTAARGKQFLMELKDDVPEINENVKAILAVASSTTVQGCDDETLVRYWADFFEKWGYGELQRADITKVMKEISE